MEGSAASLERMVSAGSYHETRRDLHGGSSSGHGRCQGSKPQRAGDGVQELGTHVDVCVLATPGNRIESKKFVIYQLGWRLEECFEPVKGT